MNTAEAHRKRVGHHRCREINGHEDSIFAMVVFVPCGLVAADIKPFRYGRHRARKLSGGYPDRDAAHPFHLVVLQI